MRELQEVAATSTVLETCEGMSRLQTRRGIHLHQEVASYRRDTTIEL
jgi:hypothetical protein